MPAAGEATDITLAKRASGARVSVVIPVRNEAATIGDIVASIRAELVNRARLVDELIVVDSDSTDDSARVARECGARVHATVDIRPDLGCHPGKGEAIWKSLFVSTGDIVVFLDGDVTTFTPAYVSRLLRPLLTQPGIVLVKGSYQRDLGLAGDDGKSQGGRVTELTARPLLNLWWPELAGVVQPLAGEWAVRRSWLAELSIPVGYGVEIATLIDTYVERGMQAIAQVELGPRAHRHQDLARLGTMAAEVIAAATLRKFGDAPADDAGIAQVDRSAGPANAGGWTRTRVNARERPPAATLLRGRGCA